MPRKNNSKERRAELLPIVAKTFAELGYRRTTTSALAKRCKVQENILYRLFTDKREMFILSIDFVYNQSAEIWKSLLEANTEHKSTAQRILEYEAAHHGEFGFYRIVFAGLSETDDKKIHAALKKMYNRFFRFIQAQIAVHQENNAKVKSPGGSDLSAWAVIGLGTVANISRELNLISDRKRKQLINSIGGSLLDLSFKEKSVEE